MSELARFTVGRQVHQDGRVATTRSHRGRANLDAMTSWQETMIIVLLIVVLVLLGGSGYVALLRERYRRGRRGDTDPPSTSRSSRAKRNR
ncbi:MAG TPA: hypothetical protein PLS63_05845 [Microthrixaceae bacterium]|nr:hypothetical protein [Microthrixaceae bacterium]